MTETTGSRGRLCQQDSNRDSTETMTWIRCNTISFGLLFVFYCLPVLTPYLSVSLQSTRSCSRFSGWSGRARLKPSNPSFNWWGWWKSKTWKCVSKIIKSHNCGKKTFTWSANVNLSTNGWEFLLVNLMLQNFNAFSDFPDVYKCILQMLTIKKGHVG